MPKGISIESDEGFTLVRKWLSPATYFFLFFALFWNGFLVVWNVIAFSSGQYFMALFSLIHGAVGLSLGYKVVADFANKTRIQVTFGTLKVNHGPLPWPGNAEIASAEIVQFFVRRTVSRSSKGGSSSSYAVMWMDQNQKSHHLIKGLTSPDQALYIEQELETYLGIRDRRVEGDFKG